MNKKADFSKGSINRNRVRQLNDIAYEDGPIIYWMDREERSDDNWALLFAQDLADRYDQPLLVVFNLVNGYLGGGKRQYQFKVDGLRELDDRFQEKGIPFVILQTNETADDLLEFLIEQSPGAVVTDFCPLRISRKWRKRVNEALTVPFFEVDAHNIVPVWVTSDKQEYAARTIRPKIHEHLNDYLIPFGSLYERDQTWPQTIPETDWEAIEAAAPENGPDPVDWIESGESAARRALERFINTRLKGYDEKRNDPTLNHLSHLSPYYHYGQLAPQTAILVVKQANAPMKDRDAYIEEAVVRRELSDNFCYYNEHYDSPKGFPDWAKKTLKKHKSDKREYVYTKEEFENANTHDELWNAAQMEMVKYGKMHGYMRMYWAKKILEWTNTPEYAMEVAIYLNDKYELDGRDPNGYVGVAWSIGGVHDRAWTERDVYGKVRYMNRNGCERKFDVDEYIKRVQNGTLI